MHNEAVDSTQIRRVARGGIAAFAIYMAGVGLAYYPVDTERALSVLR